MQLPGTQMKNCCGVSGVLAASQNYVQFRAHEHKPKVLIQFVVTDEWKEQKKIFKRSRWKPNNNNFIQKKHIRLTNL